MSNFDDYLEQKASELGLERGEQLQQIQAYLDSLYPGQCRAISLNDGVLKIGVSSASLASELRMQQVSLRAHLTEAHLKKIVVTLVSH